MSSLCNAFAKLLRWEFWLDGLRPIVSNNGSHWRKLLRRCSENIEFLADSVCFKQEFSVESFEIPFKRCEPNLKE